MPRVDPVSISRAEKETLSKVAQRVRQLPRGRWKGASTRTAGTGLALLGILTSDLKASVGWATFEQYGASQPENEAVTEDALTEYADEKCFNWSFLETGEMLASGSKVTLLYAAGRFYVIDGTCPVPEE